MSNSDNSYMERAAHDSENPYFMMARATAQDRTLSFEARGMLAYLLSKHDDWKVQVTDLMQGCGRDRAYSVIGELIDHRYIERFKLLDEGKRRKGYRYVVHEKPCPEKPYTVSPDTENTELTYKREEQNTENKDSSGAPDENQNSIPEDVTKKEKSQRPAIVDALWVNLYGYSMDDPPAVRAAHAKWCQKVTGWLLAVMPSMTGELAEKFIDDLKRRNKYASKIMDKDKWALAVADWLGRATVDNNYDTSRYDTRFSYAIYRDVEPLGPATADELPAYMQPGYSVFGGGDD